MFDSGFRTAIKDVLLNSAEGEKELPSTLSAEGSSLRRLLFSYPLAVIAVGFFLAACVLWAATGVPVHPFRLILLSHLLTTVKVLFICLTVFSVVRSVRLARQEGWRDTRAVFLRVFGQHFSRKVLVRSGRFLILADLVLVMYTVLKQAIPMVNPHVYDQELITFEGWLHGGLQPAWYFASHSGPLIWTRFLDFVYYLWFYSLPLTIVYFLLHDNAKKRTHYLSSNLALWPAGVFIGLLFPSHGPCFVDSLSFPAPGMLTCAEVQALLNGRFLQTTLQSFSFPGDLAFGCGLMALPSHHVAFAFLYAIFLWNEGRWLRYLSLSFVILIFIGSVYSGWHYAIDGYAGVVITLLVVLLLRFFLGRSKDGVDHLVL